ncbi:MAG: Coenzyme F420 hydrogenase/dehydrogenase, beta subunit C-terminal domain [Bacillota bacterium]
MSLLAAKGPVDLQKEVIETNKCTTCGLCAGMCPYIKTAAEWVAVIHPCGLTDGNCYKCCPRTETNLAFLDDLVFGVERTDHLLGNHSGIYFARALNREIAAHGQYGGVVTALASYLLEKGLADSAILTGSTEAGLAQPTVAHSRDEILACARSKYSSSPTLAALHRAARDGSRHMVVVGRPCQVTALRKMQALDRVPAGHNLSAQKVDFIVGIFCFWALSPDFYRYLRSKIGNSRVIKIDIPVEGMVVTTEDGDLRWAVDDIRQFIKPSCQECFDSTAELADVSVGSTEIDPRWNTLVVRTSVGKQIVERASADGVLEIRDYPVARMPLLRHAARNKKLRVLEMQESGAAPYLKINANYRSAVIEEGV